MSSGPHFVGTGIFAEDINPFEKAPYDTYKSLCQGILLKLGYIYDKEDKSWSDSSKTIWTYFKTTEGVLTCYVARSSDSTARANVAVENGGFEFLFQFLDDLAIEVKFGFSNEPDDENYRVHFAAPWANQAQIAHCLTVRYRDWKWATWMGSSRSKIIMKR